MWAQPFHAAPTERIPPIGARQRVAVLLNANARRVSAPTVRALSHVVAPGDVFLSRSELDARRIAQQVIDRRYETVFLGGGDGTLTCFINELMNQVVARRRHHPTAMPRLGVLKLGTGNSVASLVGASSMRGGRMLDDVLRTRAGEITGTRTIDLLLIDGKRAPFAGLGVDGKLLNDYIAVKQTFHQGVLSKVMSGPGGYVTSVALKTVPYYLTHSTSVECEVINHGSTAYRMGPDGPLGPSAGPGEVLYRGPLMMAAAGTVPYYGFELKMFPHAGKRRGLMNLRLATLPTSTILANLPKLWKGEFTHDGLHDLLVSDATIKFSRPMPFQVAGDAEGYRDEVRFQVAPEPVELVDFSPPLN